MSLENPEILPEPEGIHRPLILTLASIISALISVRWIAVILLVYGPAILNPESSQDLVFLSLDMQPSAMNCLLAAVHVLLLFAGALTYWKMYQRGVLIYVADLVLVGIWMFLPASPPLLNFSGFGVAVIAVAIGLFTMPKRLID